ncbi:hypothetical protein D3C71_1987230 [compost metagenome]
MAHVHGVQDPVATFVHIRNADDHRFRGHIQPAHEVQGVVVDGRVVAVGVISQMTDILETV